jgi:predicted nucleic acid-binding protein
VRRLAYSRRCQANSIIVACVGAFGDAGSSAGLLGTSLPTLDDPLGFDVVDAAVELYRAARRAGFTLRSSIDCLMAASALRHDVGVLHLDRDYTALARVSQLRQRKVDV